MAESRMIIQALYNFLVSSSCRKSETIFTRVNSIVLPKTVLSPKYTALASTQTGLLLQSSRRKWWVRHNP